MSVSKYESCARLKEGLLNATGLRFPMCLDPSVSVYLNTSYCHDFTWKKEGEVIGVSHYSGYCVCKQAIKWQAHFFCIKNRRFFTIGSTCIKRFRKDLMSYKKELPEAERLLLEHQIEYLKEIESSILNEQRRKKKSHKMCLSCSHFNISTQRNKVYICGGCSRSNVMKCHNCKSEFPLGFRNDSKPKVMCSRCYTSLKVKQFWNKYWNYHNGYINSL